MGQMDKNIILAPLYLFCFFVTIQETKKLIASYQSKIKQAKEEGDMIRKDCQQMIERYQVE